MFPRPAILHGFECLEHVDGGADAEAHDVERLANPARRAPSSSYGSGSLAPVAGDTPAGVARAELVDIGVRRLRWHAATKVSCSTHARKVRAGPGLPDGYGFARASVVSTGSRTWAGKGWGGYSLTYLWETSTDGTTWTTAGTTDRYTRSFNTQQNYTLTLRLTVTNDFNEQPSVTWTIPVDTGCGGTVCPG